MSASDNAPRIDLVRRHLQGMDSDRIDRTNVRKLNDEEELRTQAWRAMTLEVAPYLAEALFRLRILAAPGTNGISCDGGWRVYVDMDFALDQPPEWGPTGLVHMVFHLLFDHAERRKLQNGQRKPWNACCDAEIADDIVALDARHFRRVFALPDDAVTPASISEAIGVALPDDEIAEFYYSHLPSIGIELFDGDDGDEGGCGSGAGGEAGDFELTPEESAWLGNIAEPMSAAEADVARVSTAHAVHNHSKGRGDVPLGLAQWAELQFEVAKVDWRTKLAGKIKNAIAWSSGKVDYSNRRPGRRTAAMRMLGHSVFSPSMVKRVPVIAFVRDTSGSMTNDDLAKVSSEIVGIAEQCGVRGSSLRILDVDAAVGTVKNYTLPSELAEISGRGGTDMRIGIMAALELKPRPTAIVVGTDGDTPWPEEPVGIPVIACITGEQGHRAVAAAFVPPWIEVVEIDD